VIAELAALVPSAASAMTRRFSSIDALAAGVRLDMLKTAALLAALGQFDGAAEALARFVPVPGASRDARISERHTIEQLRAWIQSRDASKLAGRAAVGRPPLEPRRGSQQ
jgi:hypothetical protein